MAERGAPEGNKNASKGALWASAIRRALGRFNTAGVTGSLDALADKIVQAAADGDRWALEHIADRLDGKPKQSVDIHQTVERRTYAERIEAEAAQASGPSEPSLDHTVQ